MTDCGFIIIFMLYVPLENIDLMLLELTKATGHLEDYLGIANWIGMYSRLGIATCYS